MQIGKRWHRHVFWTSHKAFDLVSYDSRWDKLCGTDLPKDLVDLLTYWYNNQYNHVKWAGVQSDAFRLRLVLLVHHHKAGPVTYRPH